MRDEVAGPDGSTLSEGLGHNAETAARESVDDALMIVKSYGPWGADLNDAHRRQIVLAEEVLRLRGLYEMAVRGRAEMRIALIELRDRIKDHPAYADLTMEEELDEGGDTAELSYLARVADAALGA